jgi:ammonia channel protein AmtB
VGGLVRLQRRLRWKPTACRAGLHQHLAATAAAVLAWCVGERCTRARPPMLGAASGAVAGLVAITPAAGNVGVGGGW